MYDPVGKQVVISRNVIIDELKEWDWKDNIKKDSLIIMCDEPASEADKEIRPEEGRVQAGTSRPQRIRDMFARLQECVITLDNMVNNEGELVHYAFYADIGPNNIIYALKDTK